VRQRTVFRSAAESAGSPSFFPLGQPLPPPTDLIAQHAAIERTMNGDALVHGCSSGRGSHPEHPAAQAAETARPAAPLAVAAEEPGVSSQQDGEEVCAPSLAAAALPKEAGAAQQNTSKRKGQAQSLTSTKLRTSPFALKPAEQPEQPSATEGVEGGMTQGGKLSGCSGESAGQERPKRAIKRAPWAGAPGALAPPPARRAAVEATARIKHSLHAKEAPEAKGRRPPRAGPRRCATAGDATAAAGPAQERGPAAEISSAGVVRGALVDAAAASRYITVERAGRAALLGSTERRVCTVALLSGHAPGGRWRATLDERHRLRCSGETPGGLHAWCPALSGLLALLFAAVQPCHTGSACARGKACGSALRGPAMVCRRCKFRARP
jgi:hypothetical protein